MEAFSLLKYWRGSAVGGFGTGAGGGDGGGGANLRNTAAAATTIVTTVTHHAAEEADDDDDDDGPFFDLEFTVQDEAEEEEEYYTKDDEENNEDENESQNNDVGSQDDSGSIDEDEEGEEEREFKFTISSNSSGNDRTDQNLTLSPSDDLFFKGKLVPIEPSSLVFNSAEPNSKPQFPASLLKSATKFRVSMLRFKKSKQNVSEKTDQNNGSETATTTVADDNSTTPKQHQKQETEKEKEKEKEKQSKFFTVKFKVDEVPIKSLFTRENNSSRKSGKQNLSVEDSEEKKFSKDVMQKYLKKVKPLYIRVSKRYGEKLKFSGQLNLGAVSKSVQSTTLSAGQKPNAAESTAEKSLLPEAAEVGGETFVQVKNQKQVNNIPERLKVVCKQLGKSRSASSAVAAAPPAGVVAASRRDDSLLQQQDGIQSAILHCKRSFNASRDSDSSLFGRSVSDPFHQKFDLSRKSSDQGKDGSFESS